VKRRFKRSFEVASAVKILRDGIDKGYWTLEDLDNPPPGTQMNFADYKRFCVAQEYVGKDPVYKNLLREAEKNQEDDFIL
jgi:hypothetical protein